MDRIRNNNAKNFMLLTVLTLWFCINMLFFMRFAQVILAQTNFTTKVLAVLIIGWIILSSFYACFHVISFIFSVLVKVFWNNITKDYTNTPNVAILYVCKNDIKYKAIMSALDQDYPNYHLFILDDSTNTDEQEKANELEFEHPERISIIRRPNHSGFKAGNINHALKQIGDSYKYFAVMDADEIIPRNFLKETVAITEANPHIGFVQACHKQYSDTTFGKKIGDGIDLHWRYFLPARNLFGFVYFYGHGALIRTKACLAAGGFPEIVSEDIALATKIRELGYRGYFINDVICQEEIPPSYAAWRKRNGKVIRGTLEFLVKVFPSFVKSRHICLTEKLDLFISSSILFLPILFLCFLLLLHVIMPLLSGDSYSITLSWFNSSRADYIRTSTTLLKSLWGWDMLVFTFFIVFAPFCYLIVNFIRSPLRVIRYTWSVAAVHLSGIVHVFYETFCWLLTRHAVFNATADRSADYRTSIYIYIESVIGFLILTFGLLTGYLCLMAIGLSIAIVPLLMRYNLQNHLCSILVMFPMFFILLNFCIVPLFLLGITGALVGVTFAHH